MNVKAVIKAHGFTIEKTAERMGINRVTLMQILARNPTVGTLDRIANAIGCKTADFFADDLEPKYREFTCPHCGKPIKVDISAD